jgi:two-component system sensor histidine kinase AlgZ
MTELKVTGLRNYFSQGWQLSKRTSKGYRIAMMIALFIHLAINGSFLTSIDTNSHAEQQAFILRSILDPVVYLLICHLLLRPYLKLKVIHYPYTVKKILSLLVFLILSGVFYFSFTLLIAKLGPMNEANFQKMQFVTDNGEVDAVIGHGMIWVIGIVGAFTMLGAWTIVYLLWHQQLSKKILQKQVQQAQMQQLTNQLSPHFLFNTFNSIRALIYEDQDKAADTVTELAELFRTHLQAHLRVKSSLEEEWQVTRRYLDIEQIRLEERLTVHMDIDPKLLQQDLPTLTLLTLIENSIKHGISPSMDNGYVNIQAKIIDNNHWTLTVGNSFKPGTNTTGMQVGLANIQTRMQLMYGDTCNYAQFCEDNNFTVILTLPLIISKTKIKATKKATVDA